jgi:D-3-phosphoglycerate dehydrogenase / 2-oxoglutarate reductase
MTAKTVLVTGSGLVPDSVCEFIERRGHAVRRVARDEFTPAELHDALTGASGYLIGGYEQPLAEHFERSELEAVAWVGTDYKAYVPGWRRAVELGIAMVNAPGANAISVAEFTVLLMLTMARPFTSSIVTPDRGVTGLPAPGTDLHGRRLGIIGCGRIGTRVARIAGHGLGMDVVYHAPRRDPVVEHEVPYLAKEELLASCDVVTLHRPGPGEGEKPEIGWTELELMCAGATLINTAHHHLVDPDALLWAVETKGVRAAVDGVPEKGTWSRLVACDPERFLGVPAMAFNTHDANLRASMHTATAVCDILDAEAPEPH